MLNPPKELSDCRSMQMIVEDRKRADEFAEKGSVKHFALRIGYMPGTEKQAEDLLQRICHENEWYSTKLDQIAEERDWLEKSKKKMLEALKMCKVILNPNTELHKTISDILKYEQ